MTSLIVVGFMGVRARRDRRRGGAGLPRPRRPADGQLGHDAQPGQPGGALLTGQWAWLIAPGARAGAADHVVHADQLRHRRAEQPAPEGGLTWRALLEVTDLTSPTARATPLRSGRSTTSASPSTRASSSACSASPAAASRRSATPYCGCWTKPAAITGGTVRFDGRDITTLDEDELRPHALGRPVHGLPVEHELAQPGDHGPRAVRRRVRRASRGGGGGDTTSTSAPASCSRWSRWNATCCAATRTSCRAA